MDLLPAASFYCPQKAQTLSVQRRSWTSCFNLFFPLLPSCHFLLFISSAFQLVFPFSKGAEMATLLAYSNQTRQRHRDPLPLPTPLLPTTTTTIHPELERARGGQLLGLQLICAPPWKAFIGSMPRTTHDGHTHTHIIVVLPSSAVLQLTGWSPSQLQPLPA